MVQAWESTPLLRAFSNIRLCCCPSRGSLRGWPCHSPLVSRGKLASQAHVTRQAYAKYNPLASVNQNDTMQFVTIAWDDQVSWMRRVGAVSAAWHEGDLVRCELGPVPPTPLANETKQVEPQEPRKRLQATAGLVRVPIG